MQGSKFSIVSTSGSPGARVLKISGAMVLGDLFEFQDTIRAESASLVVLDLTEVPYMDSAALGSIVNAHVSCINHNRRLALVGVCDRVATLFRVINVDKVLAIYPTLAEALQEGQQVENRR